MTEEILYPSEETEEVVYDVVLSFGKHKGKTLRAISFIQDSYLSYLMMLIETRPLPVWIANTNLMECLPWLKKEGITSHSAKIWTYTHLGLKGLQ